MAFVSPPIFDSRLHGKADVIHHVTRELVHSRNDFARHALESPGHIHDQCGTCADASFDCGRLQTLLILSQTPVLLARYLFLRFNYGLNESHSTAPGTGREPDRGR